MQYACIGLEPGIHELRVSGRSYVLKADASTVRYVRLSDARSERGPVELTDGYEFGLTLGPGRLGEPFAAEARRSAPGIRHLFGLPIGRHRGRCPHVQAAVRASRPKSTGRRGTNEPLGNSTVGISGTFAPRLGRATAGVSDWLGATSFNESDLT